MTPQTALWLILTITVLTTALAAPLAVAFAEEYRRAKKRASDALTAYGFAATLLGWGVLGLWWYYALATHQPLIAIIPTASWLLGVTFRAVLKFAKPAPTTDGAR